MLQRLKGYEFQVFLFIVFVDVASLNLYKEFISAEKQEYVYFLSESIRTFLLYWFINWMIRLGAIKDRLTNRALQPAASAMVFYAALYVFKQGAAIVGVSWLDWTIFGLTVLFWLVRYIGFNKIRRYLRGSVH